MKKIISILCLFSVILCFISCDNDEPDYTDYLDNRLVEGTWLSQFGKRDSLVYKFKNDKLITEFYAYINGMNELKFEGEEDLGNYLLTDSQIIVPQRKDLNMLYKIPENNKDSLYIQTNNGYWYGFKKIKDQSFKYLR